MPACEKLWGDILKDCIDDRLVAFSKAMFVRFFIAEKEVYAFGDIGRGENTSIRSGGPNGLLAGPKQMNSGNGSENTA